MIQHSQSTIAAVATPVGIGGISVIRISGTDAIPSADRCFTGERPISSMHSHTLQFGTVCDPVSRETIDTVLVSVFKNPHSFTGEDVVEISTHGGYFVAQKLLAGLYATGVRPAAPGEFSLRAYLNGKMDLAQAEAVADLIHAKTAKAHRASFDQLKGKLSQSVKSLREEILNLCSLLELELDFSQEGIELADKNSVRDKLTRLEQSIRLLSDSYTEGKVIKEGVKVALVGRPNAGKSSLLNVLLKEERAIVSEIPGTTRDTIEESIIIDGIEFILYDTAGVRESRDIIEQEGIKRTTKAIGEADIILILIDGSVSLRPEEVREYLNFLDTAAGAKKTLWVLNKYDIHAPIDESILPVKPVWISCKTHHGITDLKGALAKSAIMHHDSASSSITITSIRHKEALEKALLSLAAAKSSLDAGLSGDFISLDLRAALNYLGEIIGITTPDDILNNIFSSFCIGK